MSIADQVLELSEGQLRQYTDAQTVYSALLAAARDAAEVRGSMLWRELRGVRTLIRTSAAGAQKSLGGDSEDNRRIYADFMARKERAEQRLKSLKSQYELQRRLNRAQRVGRTPRVVVDILNVLQEAGVADKFLVVGTHALYAYESAAGVRIAEGAMATRDVDILFDTRKRVALFSALKRIDASLIGLLRKADSSFEIIDDQAQTARNDDGFEVDIVRRVATPEDPHPLRMSDHDKDLWAVQVSMGERLQSARRFEQMVVSANGEMALMRTIHPLDFARIKRLLADHPQREPLKRSKDLLQADIVDYIVHQYLPNLAEQPRRAPADTTSPA